MEPLYPIGTCPLPCRSVGNLLYPRTNKMPGKTSASKLSEDLPYGLSGIRRLSACIRCGPAFCQSSSIHNSLRSINLATASCSQQKPTGLFAYRSRGLETFVFFLRKSCGFRNFAYSENLYVLMQHSLLRKSQESSL